MMGQDFRMKKKQIQQSSLLHGDANHHNAFLPNLESVRAS